MFIIIHNVNVLSSDNAFEASHKAKKSNEKQNTYGRSTHSLKHIKNFCQNCTKMSAFECGYKMFISAEWTDVTCFTLSLKKCSAGIVSAAIFDLIKRNEITFRKLILSI